MDTLNCKILIPHLINVRILNLVSFSNLGFEKAYCHYRNQDMESSKSTLEKCGDSPRKQELMTQILYRMEEYGKAYDSCRELIRIAEDEYEEERQTNLAAINACLIASGAVNF